MRICSRGRPACGTGKPNGDRMDTHRTKQTYDRISKVYDLMEMLSERTLFRRWRREVFGMARGRILEVGVGTGKNIPHYPPGSSVFAIDLSTGMMERARGRARQAAVKPRLILMDAEHLGFKGDSFHTVVATFVYCSVADPVGGFRELERVCKPDGRILLVEHVRSSGSIRGSIMDAVNPLIAKLIGFNINRDTVGNVRRGGLEVTVVDSLKGDLFKRVQAKPTIQ